MKVIDIHAHVVLEKTLKSIPSYGPEIGGTEENPWFRIGNYKLEGVRYRNTPFMDEKMRIEQMDLMGIDYQVLSPNPLTYFHHIDNKTAIDYCKFHNDELASLVENNLDRLGGLASLPIQDPKAACAELERSVSLGLKGGYIGTDFPQGFDDHSMEDFYSACTELDLPLFIHPAPQGIDGPLYEKKLHKYSLDLTVGFANQESLTIGTIIFSGILHRHPTLDICISHGGGNIPFLKGRLAHAAMNRPDSPDWLKKNGEFERQLQLLWYDNHVHSKSSLGLLESVVGKERLVLGTNFLGWDQPDIKKLSNIPSYLANNAKKLLRMD